MQNQSSLTPEVAVTPEVAESADNCRINDRLPLYVDVDGTLIYTDLLYESVPLLIKRNLLYGFMCLVWLIGGRSRLKAEIAARVNLDPALLTYNDEFLTYLRQEHLAGRRLVLASASNQKPVRQIADHLGLFDSVIASDAMVNLKAGAKLQVILAHCKGSGFAYAGNSAADLPIWERANEIIVVNASPSVLAKASALRAPSLTITQRPVGRRTVARALRLHQWAKNALLFVPLIAAHDLSTGKWLATLAAFVAFGLCASATYVINDLLDLTSDRAHPRKRDRPFAASTLSIPFGVALVAVLLPLSMWMAVHVSMMFLGWLLLYIAVTLVYSVHLKRLAIIDTLVLALLYTHRILAGGIASTVIISNWLLTVSFFMFLSLALAKRCTELEFMNDAGGDSLAGRGYRTTDLPYLISMGISSGFVAVMVLALYIDSQAGGILYPQAEVLWLLLPVMLFWIMRLWIKISRMEIYDDPLLFAITDPASWVVAVSVGLIALGATFRIFS